MASQASTGTSRLAQMQMRFQQRQQQEKEQRRIELSGSGGSTNETDIARNSLTTAKTSNIGNGKVRQMFDERRRGAGIDRSNPLKPIKPISSSSKAISTPTLTAPQQNKITNKVYGVRSHDQITAKTSVTQARKQATNVVTKQTTSVSSRSSRSERMTEHNNNQTYNKAIDELDGLGFGDSIINDRNNNTNGHNNKKGAYNGNSTQLTSATGIKLNPVLTKKSPPARTASRQGSTTTSNQVAGTTTTTKRQLNGGTTTQSMKSESISSARSNKTANSVKSPPNSARSMADSPSPTPKEPVPAGMAACRICGRHFNEDRVAKHEQVCEKMSNSKRKVFDASKHRVKGTEAEQFVRKKPNSRQNQRSGNYISAVAISGQTIPSKKNSWRQKHEEFIAAIRAAKQVQAHLARGGKLSDLPPPPPSENPDYIQCPHCMRRFNQTAAERHIPKCATMLHNKPKPGASSQVQQQSRRR